MGERDASGDGFTGGVSRSPEEAAWRDLISRYEAPSDRGSGPVPWPDREDLPDAGQSPPAADRTSADDDGRAPAADGTGAADGSDGAKSPGAPDTTDDPQTPEGSTGQGAWFSRARVIRPATPPVSPMRPRPSAQDSHLPGEAGHNAPGEPGGRGRADLFGDDSDDPDDHYVPPPPPPLPHLDPVAKGAWLALFGGPAYLLISTLIGLNAPGWAALLAVAAFIGGFAVVLMRLGDKPSRGDGPDNGAVL
jgi:hypothetical protein